MVKTNKFKNIPFLLTIFVDLLLFVAVFFLMNYVQRLLEEDAKINLTEIVTQNKDVITSKLMLEVNNLDLVADQLMERYSRIPNPGQESLRPLFLQYVQERGDDRLFIAGLDGTAVFPDGQEIGISGRNYFIRAVDGTQNISERTTSRRPGGEDIFVISVPLNVNGQIIGTVQKQYTPEEMYDLCSVSLFSEQGYMYIINSEGYILISSQPETYNRESDNYYRIIYLDDPDASRRLEGDIRGGRSGFMEARINGERVFSAYTPIDQVYDWYLISSVATSAVSPNANAVIRLFYVILVAVVLFFALSMVYYLNMKNKQQAKLEKIAFVDTVTQGHSYAKFALELQALLQTQGEKLYYILTFDIDNFKFINNFYGFDAGDKILRAICEMYAQKLKGDEYIARMYSDHFVILLEDATEERLNTLFEPEVSIDGIEVYLSAGLYPILHPNEAVSLMVDKAGLAAQKIKGMRYKKVGIYSEDFDKEMIYNEQLKRAVEQALADKEIIPFFQPKVDIDSRLLVGAEALARWRTKEGKLIPPGDFISVCEKTGLIVLVDMAIFEQTLQFIRLNLDNGVRCVPISVNFSRMHLLNKDFVHTLLEKLEQYQVPPELIELELTETVIFDNYQKIEEFIDALHAIGLQISMDDFGSGYSSLHMLKDIDIDVLKIDRGFLLDTAKSDRQKAVFAAIAQMAQRLKIKVVVEGVETIENVSLMREFGCTIAQGYYYAKPMDKAQFEKVYKEGAVC